MLVRDLIEQLQELDPNMPIYLATDGEGNDFRKAEVVESAVWEAEAGGFDFDSEDEPNAALIWPVY